MSPPASAAKRCGCADACTAQRGRILTRVFALPPQWAAGSLQPYGPLSLSPAAGVLNYGQGIFEGMKAYRTVAGRIVLFRPDQASAQPLA
jgi:hypothetical protein